MIMNSLAFIQSMSRLALFVAVPDELLVAYLDGCVEGHGLVLDVAVLDVVLVAVLLLLRLVVRDVRDMALLVVTVVALNLEKK